MPQFFVVAQLRGRATTLQQPLPSLGRADSVYDERRHCRHGVTSVTAVTLVTAG